MAFSEKKKLIKCLQFGFCIDMMQKKALVAIFLYFYYSLNTNN